MKISAARRSARTRRWAGGALERRYRMPRVGRDHRARVRRLVARLFPRDVMGAADVANPQVGALTAWLVGWSPCASPSYPSFEPQNGW